MYLGYNYLQIFLARIRLWLVISELACCCHSAAFLSVSLVIHYYNQWYTMALEKMVSWYLCRTTVAVAAAVRSMQRTFRILIGGLKVDNSSSQTF